LTQLLLKVVPVCHMTYVTGTCRKYTCSKIMSSIQIVHEVKSSQVAFNKRQWQSHCT